MSEYNPNLWRGPFIPFRIPFHVETNPTHQPSDDPLISLCFNEDYLPYLQGALKAAASELSFEGPRDHVLAWVRAMSELLLIEPQDGCATIPINWYLVNTAYAGTHLVAQTLDARDPDYRTVVQYEADNDVTGIDFQAVGHSLADASIVGGNFHYARFATFDGSSVDWTLTWTLCDDTTDGANNTGPSTFINDLNLKSLRVQTFQPAVIYGYIQIWDPWICGVA